MKHGSSMYSVKTMDNGKILSGKPFSYPSLAKGFILSLTMFMVAVFLITGCKNRPGDGQLINSSSSMEELVQKTLQALSREDEGALSSLALTEEEYRRYIWPALPLSKIEQWQKQYAFVWGQVSARSSQGLAIILQKYGGQQFEYRSLRAAGGRAPYADCIVHKDVKIAVKDASGMEQEVKIFGSLVEMNDQFKIMSFDID
jgi:hypothetical protein